MATTRSVWACILFFVGVLVGCMDEASAIPEGVEMKVTGEQTASPNYSLALDNEFVRVKHENEMIFFREQDHLLIRAIEVKYSRAYTREEAMREATNDAPEPEKVFRVTLGELDFLGYYKYIVEKDASGPGFTGYIFGSKDFLLLEFSFDTLQKVEAVEKIWIGARRR